MDRILAFGAEDPSSNLGGVIKLKLLIFLSPCHRPKRDI